MWWCRCVSSEHTQDLQAGGAEVQGYPTSQQVQGQSGWWETSPAPTMLKKRQGKQRINRRRHERWPIHLPNSAENSNSGLSSSGEMCSWLNQVVQTYQLLFSRQPLLSENSRRNRALKLVWTEHHNEMDPKSFSFAPLQWEALNSLCSLILRGKEMPGSAATGIWGLGYALLLTWEKTYFHRGFIDKPILKSRPYAHLCLWVSLLGIAGVKYKTLHKHPCSKPLDRIPHTLTVISATKYWSFNKEQRRTSSQKK